MGLIVIDYSEVYFTLLNDTPVPHKRSGKFVVMSNGGQRYAVFSPHELSTYHANIIERFLRQHGIQGRYNEKGGFFHFTPTIWAVEGGGYWELDDAGGTLQISGSSKSYGSVDFQALAVELHLTDTFRALQVVIAPSPSVP
jgi:hypothetical protein